MTTPRDQFDDLLDQWLDGDLDTAQTAQWEALLQENPDLAEIARQEKELVNALRQSSRETKVPEDLGHRLLDTLSREEIEREGENRWAGLQRIGLLAAGILVFGSIYYFVGESTFDEPVPTEPGADAMEMAEVRAERPPDEPPARAMTDTRTMDREQPGEAEPGIDMLAMASPPTPPSTDLPMLYRRLTVAGDRLVLLTADGDTARAIAATDHPVLELPEERLYAVVAILPPERTARAAPAPDREERVGELAGEMAEIRATQTEPGIDIIMEIANGAMMEDDTTVGQIFTDAGLPEPSQRSNRRVAVWEFESVGDALLAVKLLQSDDSTPAQHTMEHLDLLPMADVWLLLTDTASGP